MMSADSAPRVPRASGAAVSQLLGHATRQGKCEDAHGHAASAIRGIKQIDPGEKHSVVAVQKVSNQDRLVIIVIISSMHANRDHTA